MCDCLLALGPATARRATLFAKNSDRPPHEAQRVEWHPPRRDRARVRTTYIEVDPFADTTLGFLGSRPSWLWGVEHGVNEAGVAAGNETIFTTLDPRDAPPALLGMDLVRLALERSTTAKDAVSTVVELLERHGQGGSGHDHRFRPYWSSFLIADPTDAWVVETSGREWEAEQVTMTRAISNRTTIAAFDAAHRHPGQPVERLVDPRLAASNRVLASTPVDVGAMRAHLRSHVGEDGHTVCMHAVSGRADDEATAASMIVELAVGERPLARMLLGSPCRSVYVPMYVGRAVGSPPAGERFASLTDAQVEALQALEPILDREARDDDGWAAEAWAQVTAVLEA